MDSGEARILDGKKISADRTPELIARIGAVKKDAGELSLATIRIGDSKDAFYYSKAITALSLKLQFAHVPFEFSVQTTGHEISETINRLNADPKITGVMIFSPLPAGIDHYRLLCSVNPWKDVESRVAIFRIGQMSVVSPTAKAAVMLVDEALKDSGQTCAGKEAVVVGRSDIVGKPAAVFLLDRHATVTVCHTKTADLADRVRSADIVIAAAGKPNLIKGDWIKRGAIVIDVGENFVGGKMVGDVDFESAKKRAGYLTPVPGGVGPLTNVVLVENLVSLALWKKQREESR